MKFKSRKVILLSLVIFGVTELLMGILIYGIMVGDIQKNEYWDLFIVGGVICFLIWFYFGTRYELTSTDFKYYSSPFRGKLALIRIKEVLVGTTVWVGFRPATARNGILIKYDTYEELYISPKTNESFVIVLKELKSDIIISYK
jgi:hypothetical protein